jgi:RNA polymerase sigma factor (sigma-70 family)
LSSHATGALRLPWAASRPASLHVDRGNDGDEALARRAAAGDGAAFATLYDRYERRAFNLCYRITGSPEDAADATQETFVAVLERLPRLEGRELNFGSYLMTAARNAAYDAIARRKRTAPAGDIHETAVPVGAGGEDPDRPESRALRAAHQEQIRAANEGLPPRQREVLALRELEELSYDDVAEIMGMNRNSVAQLISRARINLRDNLRQTALGSVAAASPLCERALPLLALRQDDALEDDETSGWLAEHLTGCGTCRVRVEAMEEAGVAYRLWLPLVPALWLRGEAIAHAAERVGADWSAFAGAGRSRGRHLRLAAAAGALLVFAFVFALVDRAQTPTREFPAPPPEVETTAAPPPVATAPAPAAKAAKPVERRAPRRRAKSHPVEPTAPAVDAAPVAAAVPATPAAGPAPVERARRSVPERRRKDPAPAPADPVVADPPAEPAAPPGDLVVTPEQPAQPEPPAEDPVEPRPCGATTAAVSCPPPPPPTCVRCGIVGVQPTPKPPKTLAAAEAVESALAPR